MSTNSTNSNPPTTEIHYYCAECTYCGKKLGSFDKPYTESLIKDHNKRNTYHNTYENEIDKIKHSHDGYTSISHKLTDLMDLAHQGYILAELAPLHTRLQSASKKRVSHKLRLLRKLQGEDGHTGSNDQEFVIFLDCKDSLEDLLSLVSILLAFDYPLQENFDRPGTILCNALDAKKGKLPLMSPIDGKEFKIDNVTIKLHFDNKNPAAVRFNFEWKIVDESYQKVTHPKYKAKIGNNFKLIQNNKK